MELVKRSETGSTIDRPWSRLDRFIDEMWRSPFSAFFRAPSLFEMGDTEYLHWHPYADIEETDDDYVLRMDLAGISKKDINISLENNVLTVRGERKRDEADKRTVHVNERFFGKFYRSFVLPSTVDPDSVNAEYKDGVLTVTIKKREEAKPKAIEIH
ncbi:MAG: Hsp20/alpha crystallin family protein [bacterium]